jgi:hypothetical protein
MSLRILLVVAGCTLFAGAGFGQRSWKFRSDNYVGIVAGELGNYGQVQTVNGLYKGPWFVGIGTGLDYYRFRTVPLYLSVNRDLFGSKESSGFFISLNGGTTLPWFSGYPMPYGIQSRTFSPGFWGNGGFGYRQKLSEKTDKAFLFSISYGMKKLSEKQKSLPPLCFGCMYGPEQQTTQTYEYDYVNRTFLFSIGFQF